jgi:hypothetical protein
MTVESLRDCRDDFADLPPALWAKIFAPVVLNALRALQDSGGGDAGDPGPVLADWLPAGQPQRNLCLVEVVLAAAGHGPDTLLAVMTGADAVFLLDHLRCHLSDAHCPDFYDAHFPDFLSSTFCWFLLRAFPGLYYAHFPDL